MKLVTAETALPTPKKGNRVRVNWKWLAPALAVEVGIIGAVLVSQYQFAERYQGPVGPDNPIALTLPDWVPAIGGEHTMFWVMAMLGGLTMALIELCRVPAACAAATHRHISKRIIAWAGVILAVFITTKSLAQIFEQQFHPRIVEVTKAANKVAEEKATLKTLEDSQAEPSAANADTQRQIAEATDRVKALNKNLDTIGRRPPPVPTRTRTPIRDAKGKVVWKSTVTYKPSPWDGEKIQKQIDVEQANINALQAGAAKNRADIVAGAMQVSDQKTAVTKAEGAQKEAVLNSQLHSFTGMVFGKAPNEVSDGEVFWFMRIFVLVAALAGASAATILAWLAFTRFPPTDEPDFKPFHAKEGKVVYDVMLPSSLERIIRRAA